MASMQVRKTTQIAWNLDIHKDGWGFDRGKDAYIVTQNKADGSRKVMLYPLADMSQYILLTFSAEEARELDAQAEKNNKPPS